MRYEATTTTSMRRVVILLAVVSVIAFTFLLPGCCRAEEAPTTRRVPFELLGSCRIDLGSALPVIPPVIPNLMVVTDQRDCAWIASGLKLFIKEAETIDFENNIVLSAGCCLDSYSSFRVKYVEQTGAEVSVGIERFDLYPGTAKPCVSFPPTDCEYHLVLIERASFQPNGELHFVLLDTLSEGELAEATAFVADKGPVYTREIPLETLRSTVRATSKNYLVITNQSEYEQSIIERVRESIKETMSDVDFAKHILLVVSGEVPSSDCRISISRIIQTGTRVDALVEILPPEPGEGGLPAFFFETTFVLVERDSFPPGMEGIPFDQNII